MGLCKLSLRSLVNEDLTNILDAEIGLDPIELARVLLSLPPKTRIMGFKKSKIGDIIFEHTILVDNPCFNDGEIIQPSYVRHIMKNRQTDRLVEFSQHGELDLKKAINIKD